MISDFETATTPTPFVCPYCLVRQPKSIDHFLPKDQFPEYSILTWNLVLVCDPCNRLKGDRLISPVRSVLNPYFDPIPLEPVLFAAVAVDRRKLGLTFEVQTDPAVDPALVTLIHRHVQEFDLLAEYRGEASGYVNGIVSALIAQHRAPISQDQLDAALDVEMRRLTGYPVNAWQVAIIAALELAPDLLAFINQKIENAPLPPRPRPRPDLTALRAAAASAAAAM